MSFSTAIYADARTPAIAIYVNASAAEIRIR